MEEKDQEPKEKVYFVLAVGNNYAVHYEREEEWGEKTLIRVSPLYSHMEFAIAEKHNIETTGRYRCPEEIIDPE